jgi:hypothetical protein
MPWVLKGGNFDVGGHTFVKDGVNDPVDTVKAVESGKLKLLLTAVLAPDSSWKSVEAASVRDETWYTKLV